MMKVVLKLFLVCLSLVASFYALAAPVSVGDVNQVRQAAGMQLLSENRLLVEAAQQHARYLDENFNRHIHSKGYAHEQSPNLPLFTGATPVERGLEVGYPHRLIYENISVGNETVGKSVDALMSAIYHRFTFLDFSITEIGAAKVGRNYVYEMGRTALRLTCEAPGYDALAQQPVACDTQFMRRSSYDLLCQQIPQSAKYQPPYHQRCRNGQLLNESFVETTCNYPTQESRWNGSGSYYSFCQSGEKIKAAWLDRQCEDDTSNAQYLHSGRYYTICDEGAKVHAEWYQQYCESLSTEDLYTDSGTYVQLCNEDHKLRTEYVENLTKSAHLKNPEGVIWPVDQAINVQPAFFNEDPHPTPDKVVTGYPISIQFNPSQVQQAVINQFIFERQVRDSYGGLAWEVIPDIRAINAYNDVNQQFTPHQFAWFPEQRLDWNSRYRYTISVQLDGRHVDYSAQFSTTELSAPIVELELDTEEVVITQTDFYLFQRSTQLEPEPFKDIRFSTRKFVDMEVELIDPSTLKVSLSRTACLPAKILFASGRELTISPCF